MHLHKFVAPLLIVIGIISLSSTFIVPLSVYAQVVPLSNDLQAEWKLDEGKDTSISDSIQGSSGSVVTMSIANTPLWGPGKMGTALDFKQNSWVKIASQSAINNMNSFTVTAWVYVRAGGKRIITKGDTRPVRYYLAAPQGGQYLDFGAGYDGSLGEWQTAAGTLPNNGWHQVAVSYSFDITSQPSLYIDGVLQSAIMISAPKGNPEPDNANTYIGGRGDGVANFDGMIDEVRIYGHALTAAEIKAQYQADVSAANPGQPNIVIIMSDDQDDQGSLDVMAQVKTLLINQGVRFTNSFVVNPLCCSSRASFLTGQYSHNNGVWQNAHNSNGFDGGYGALAPTAANTLPVWMQEAGYRTGLIGKYLNQYGIDTPATGVPPGWSTWDGLVDPSTYSYYNYTLNENGVLRTYGNTAADYQTDVLTGKALDFINASVNSPQPFFLWLTPLAPHASAPDYNTPVPSPKYAGAYSRLPPLIPSSFNEGDISDKPSFMKKLPLMSSSLIALTTDSYRKRREALLSVDDMVAQVVAALKATGKLDNTYIIYTSDNGFFQGQHRLPIEKRLGYEESIRVPLIIRGPGVPSGQTRSSIVANIDLPATILDIAQAKTGRALDGHSLLPLLTVNNSVPWRSDLLFEGTGKIPFDTTFYSSYAGVRTSQFAYIEHRSLSGVVEKELYDLKTDPYELQNKQNDPKYATVMKQLQGELSWLHSCQGAACWVTASAVVFKSIPLPTFVAAAASDDMAPSDIGTPNPIDIPVPAEPGDLEESALTPIQRDQFYLQDKNPIPVRGAVNDSSVTQTLLVTPTTTLNPVSVAQSPSQGSFSHTLQVGASGDDVKSLQKLLARDSSLYPEGMITGYFGTLTKQAVIKFQERYKDQILTPAGLSQGTGFVGQGTLRQLNMLMGQ